MMMSPKEPNTGVLLGLPFWVLSRPGYFSFLIDREERKREREREREREEGREREREQPRDRG